MCGISVLLDRSASHEAVDLLRRMHEPIRHRGPDGEGLLLVDPDGRRERRDAVAPGLPPFPLRLGMAFRRLRILDLSEAAAQPMGSPDGSLWMVFNGEIYNFGELRGELRSLGRPFRSSGDAEVVLAAFEAWGERCFERFEGMWAVVIADLTRRRLVASRDRFGIKPLYWATDGPRLFLASEAKQILKALAVRPKAHAGLVSRYLRGGRLPSTEETFFEGIRSVPPATWFEVPFAGEGAFSPEFHRYWDLAAFSCPASDRPPQPYAEALAAFRCRLEQAVRTHCQSDVGVGSLLSGGLDSSTLVGLAVGARGAESFPTFSLGDRQAAPELCEMGYVDAMVRRYGLVNHEATVDAAWIARSARRAIRALEEPPLGLAVLAQHRVFELCREHGTTVVLDGQGADEILAGYPYSERTLLVDRLARLRLGDFARELDAIARRESRGALAVLSGYFLVPAAARMRQARYDWVARGYERGAAGHESEEALRDRGYDRSRVNRRAHYDVRRGNVKLVLDYTDKNAMAHTVEARVPYFDRRLVEQAFSLPDVYKVGGGERKRILRDAARSVVPSEIAERTDRIGFGLPEGPILTSLWPSIRELLLDGRFLSSPCFERDAARRLLAGFGEGRRDDVRAVWRLYALALWSEEFGAEIA